MALAIESHSTPPFSSRSFVGLCKAAADPLRVEILRVLSRDSFGVQELAFIFSVPQPGMSHHLKILFRSGLVVSRRQGNAIFYQRALLKGKDPLDAFHGNLYEAIDAVALDEKTQRKIATVYKERAEQSREYFKKNAERFEESQGMLCELKQYLPNLKELLDLMQLPKKRRALEVGPGYGELLGELSGRFDEVTALDDSAEMLELAKKSVGPRAKKIEFVHASLESYSPKVPLDTVVLNMVLHHLASPAKAFQKLAQWVKKEGYLLLAELSSHNQEWTKKSCGDVWLGFDSHELNEWARLSGFMEEQSSYLGLKNGFQIQLKLFRRV